MKPPSQHTAKWAIVKLREIASENQTDFHNLMPLILAWDTGDKDKFFMLSRGVLPFYAKQSVFIEEILEYAQSLLGKVMIQEYPSVEVAGRRMTVSHQTFEQRLQDFTG